MPARADRIDKFLDSSSIIRLEFTKSRKSLRSCFPRFSPYYRPVIFPLLSIHRNLDASHARPRDTRDTHQRYAFVSNLDIMRATLCLVVSPSHRPSSRSFFEIPRIKLFLRVPVTVRWRTTKPSSSLSHSCNRIPN